MYVWWGFFGGFFLYEFAYIFVGDESPKIIPNYIYPDRYDPLRQMNFN